MSTGPKLLYLGYAFPPGISALFPELQPAGHLIETRLIDSLRSSFEIRSVGISEVDVSEVQTTDADSPGLPHALNLLDRPPALRNWMRSLKRLRQTYARWQHEGWRPDVIVVCNFSPVYNAFVRRLAQQADRPRLALYLADSPLLGVRVPPLKRLRYRLKPFKWMDDEMADCYDACVAVSADTEARFSTREKPWLWLPNGMDPDRLRSETAGSCSGPIIFGYFGHAGEHTGLPQLLRVFAARTRPAELRICAFGKARQGLREKYGGHPSISFHGPFDPEGCVDFGTGCDVLVNPRPVMPGNENNFPSKVFEYALTGRCILTTRLSGVETILGPSATYMEAGELEHDLERTLRKLADEARPELNRRGAEIQQRLLSRYTWERQGSRLATFLHEVCGKR